ncbi:MAG TPA: alpha/beta hydrolase [Drouetiella sp.]|jgi:pimeloyl-ACP methyl ester carboxylesterase
MNATIRKPFLTRPGLKIAALRLLSAAALSCAFTANLPPGAQAGDLAISPIGNQQINTTSKNPVFFVTDRKETVDGDRIRYVDGRSNTLSYGVSYPDASSGNQIKTVVFSGADQFFAELSKFDKGEPILFLHGYHRNFKTSVDLGFETAKGLDRPIVLFSWPTRNSYVKYFVDETNAEWAGPHFASFLTELGAHVPNRNITIVSHSVGAKVMTSAFQTLAFNRTLNDFPKFGKVLMCSPDIDRDIFVEQAPLVKMFGADVRIYVSTRDKRIAVSNFFHGGYRIGSATKLQNIDGIEFVNFEAEDKRRFGHSIPYLLLSRAIRGELAASAEHTSLPAFQPAH